MVDNISSIHSRILITIQLDTLVLIVFIICVSDWIVESNIDIFVLGLFDFESISNKIKK